VIELGLHLAAERLATVIAGTAGDDQMTGANSLAHARVGSICFPGEKRSYFTSWIITKKILKDCTLRRLLPLKEI
jgi:hypothetical protein